MKVLKYNFLFIFLFVIILCITSSVFAGKVKPGDKVTIIDKEGAWLCPFSIQFCLKEDAIMMIPKGTVLIIENIGSAIVPGEPFYYLVTYKGKRGWIFDFFTDKPMY